MYSKRWQKKISSNMEDYLEAIALLKKKNGVARVKDIGKFLNVKTPSVTSGINVLSKKGLVVHERYGYVGLRKEGEKLARDIQKRHAVLAEFFANILKIDSKVAQEDACKMEHSISPQTFSKLEKFVGFVGSCSEGVRPDWLKSFDYYFKTGKRPKCKIREMKKKVKG